MGRIDRLSNKRDPDHFSLRFRSEFAGIAKQVRDYTATLNLSKNLYETRTLCWCLLLSVFEISDACFSLLANRQLSPAHALGRSLLEHIVDLRLLALRNDVVSNRRFAEYHRLWIYWHRKDLRSQSREIPRIEKEYREYISKEFPDIVERFSKREEGFNYCLPDWPAVDQQIRKQYGLHWSGLDYTSRVNETKRLVTVLGSHHQGRLVESSDESYDRTRFFYYIHCLHVHPTAYSAIPQFNPKRGSFELEWLPSDSALSLCEKEQYLAILEAITSFALVLDGKGFDRLADLLENSVVATDAFKAFAEDK